MGTRRKRGLAERSNSILREMWDGIFGGNWRIYFYWRPPACTQNL